VFTWIQFFPLWLNIKLINIYIWFDLVSDLIWRRIYWKAIWFKLVKASWHRLFLATFLVLYTSPYVKNVWRIVSFKSSTMVRITSCAFSLHILWVMFLDNLKRDVLAWLISCCSTLETWIFPLSSTATTFLSEITLGKSLWQQLQVPRYLDGSKQIIISVSKLLFSFVIVFHFFFPNFVISGDKHWHVNNLFGARTIGRVNL